MGDFYSSPSKHQPRPCLKEITLAPTFVRPHSYHYFSSSLPLSPTPRSHSHRYHVYRFLRPRNTQTESCFTAIPLIAFSLVTSVTILEGRRRTKKMERHRQRGKSTENNVSCLYPRCGIGNADVHDTYMTRLECMHVSPFRSGAFVLVALKDSKRELLSVAA